MMKELQIKASMLLVGYIASLDIVFLLLGKGNSSFWLSDKFFLYFLLPILFFALSFVSQPSDAMFYARYQKRTKVFLNKLNVMLEVSFIIVNIFWLNILVLSFCNGCPNIFIVWKWHARYLLGAILADTVLILLDSYSFFGDETWTSIALYLFIIAEVAVITPKSKNLTGSSIRIVFSWLFFDKFYWFIIVICIIVISSTLALVNYRKRDYL